MNSAVEPQRRSRWKAYLLLGRVSNLPTVWTNCIAGMVLAGVLPDAATVSLVSVAISAFYVGGMFLNDAFDSGFDARHRPERPVPSGEVSRGEAFAVGFGLLAVGEGLLMLPAILGRRPVSGEVLLWGALLAALIVYYNYRHKRDPLSPVVMALCRVMVYFAAAAYVGTALITDVSIGGVLLAAYLIGLTYVAKQENLARLSSAWPLAFLGAPFVYHGRVIPGFDIAALLWLVLLAWVVYALSFLYRTEGRSIPRTVISLIAGISLLDALAIASTGAPTVLVAVVVAGFVLTLLFQRIVPGT